MNVRLNDYNVYKDGIRNDADFINQAILDCYNSGGGYVYVEGIHMSGSIELLDNVYLYLKEGAKIILSNNLEDFYNINDSRDTSINRPTWENCEYNGKPSKYFIYAVNKVNCGILGEGTINGNQEIFYGNITKWHIEGAFYPRIPLIYFEGCSNIKFEGVTLEKSAFWTVHLVGCNKVLIDGLNINNDLRMVNSDGIDPDHCKDVVIKNCNINASDDCIDFKTTEAFKKYGACENILVDNCNLMSTSAAIKFGTESVSDFKNININNCIIKGSNRGISLMLRDEGNISDITFNNIKIETRRFSPINWWGKAEAIALTAVKRKQGVTVGNINNVVFNDISATCENGILIYGEKHSNISNIKFNNIMLGIADETDWEKKGIDLRPSEYGILDGKTFVININNASNIVLNDFDYVVDDDINIEDEIIINNSSVDINYVEY